MTTDDTAPATKQDLKHFMEQVMTALTDMENRMEERIKKSEKEMKSHFDTVAENIKHDFQGAFKDKIEQHDDRITRLEEHAGLAAV